MVFEQTRIQMVNRSLRNFKNFGNLEDLVYMIEISILEDYLSGLRFIIQCNIWFKWVCGHTRTYLKPSEHPLENQFSYDIDKSRNELYWDISDTSWWLHRCDNLKTLVSESLCFVQILWFELFLYVVTNINRLQHPSPASYPEKVLHPSNRFHRMN